jgi:outer membrane lipoprotein SlyB
MTFAGHTYALDTKSQVYESKSGTKKDVALIGGGAVAGGIVGAVVGGDKSVAKGAAAGAVAGTGASLLTRGPQLTLEAGTVLNASLDQSVAVRRS